MTEKVVSKPSTITVPYAWVILAMVYLASIAAPLNQFKVPPIIPALMQTMQIELTQAGTLMSVFSVTGLILALPAGVILQRLGSRITGMIALGFMATGSVIGALSATYETLLISRVIEGAGVGLIGVVAPATIAMWFPPSRQGSPMGIWATWMPVGGLIMYLLAPTLVLTFGWQAVWWVGAGFAMVVMLFYGSFMRRPPDQASTTQQRPEALQIKKALANRDIWMLALQFTCFTLAMTSIGTYYPTFLNQVRGYSLETAAIISSVATMVILVSAPLAGWFSDRINSRRLLFSLPFLVIAVLLVFPFRVTGWQIIILMVLQGFIVGAIPTATLLAAPEVMGKPQWAGLGLAVILIGQSLGQLVAPVLFGQFVIDYGWVVAGYLMIPVCLLGFASGWMVRIR